MAIYREPRDIESLLIWAYRDQLVGRDTVGLAQIEAEVSGLEWHGHSADGCFSIEKLAGLGVRVDESCMPGFYECHPDAETIHQAVKELSHGPKGNPLAPSVVMQHARTGSRPEWCPPKPSRLVPLWKYCPEYDAYGRPEPKAVMKEQIEPNVWHCPLELDGMPPEAIIQMNRQIYGCWWRAIDRLADTLSGCLTKYQPVPPKAPRYPWRKSVRASEEKHQDFRCKTAKNACEHSA